MFNPKFGDKLEMPFMVFGRQSSEMTKATIGIQEPSDSAEAPELQYKKVTNWRSARPCTMIKN